MALCWTTKRSAYNEIPGAVKSSGDIKNTVSSLAKQNETNKCTLCKMPETKKILDGVNTRFFHRVSA